MLENRTKASCQEIQMLETLEDLRELRHRHARVNTEKMLQQNKEENERLLALQEEEDEAFVRLVMLLLMLLAGISNDTGTVGRHWRLLMSSPATQRPTLLTDTASCQKWPPMTAYHVSHCFFFDSRHDSALVELYIAFQKSEIPGTFSKNSQQIWLCGSNFWSEE